VMRMLDPSAELSTIHISIDPDLGARCELAHSTVKKAGS
jgi:hypothetical protein